MRFGRLIVGETATREYAALGNRCNGAWVAAKNESGEPFGTAKDRRNAALLLKYSHLNPLITVQITSGNSGYSLGMLAKELDPGGERIKVVNIVGNGIRPEIKEKLESCSIVYETDLTNGIVDLPWMKRLARLALSYDGPDKNIIGVESFGLREGYRIIVDEIYKDLNGTMPTHIFVPLGSGELLTEISHRAIETYGDKCPKMIGATIGNNVFASEEDRRGLKDLGNIADKLVSGFSNYATLVECLKRDGIVDIRVIDGQRIIEECRFLAGLGIETEPSSAVAFCGAFEYGLQGGDVAVIIGSGKGNYSEMASSENNKEHGKLGIGLGRTREESAYVADDPEKKMTLLGWDLSEAIKSGDMKNFDTLLADNAPVGYVDDEGNSPLSIAAAMGRTEMAAKLIANKAEVNCQNSGGYSPLMLACVGGHKETAELLIRSGAYNGFENIEHKNALMVASEMGNLEIVKILIKHKTLPESQDIWSAPGECFLPVLGTDRKKGERMLGRELKYTNALLLAAENGHEEVVKALLEGHGRRWISLIEHSDSDGNTALIMASKNGHCKIVKRLLRWTEIPQMVINKKNNLGEDALMKAAENGHAQVVRALVRAEADLTAKNKQDETSLIIAARKGHIEAARVLVAAGANPNAMRNPANGGGNALSVACEIKESKDAVSLINDLVKKGAKLNIPDSEGLSPFYRACFLGHREKVKAFLKAGLNPKKRSPDGTYAWDLATMDMEDSGARCGIIIDLIEAGANGKTLMPVLLKYAMGPENLWAVEYALKKGVSPNFKFKYGDSLLHLAAFFGSTGIVKFLVKKGADAKYADEFGCTVLMMSAERGDLESIKCLLSAGAKASSRNDDGQAALDYARGSRKRDEETEQTFVEIMRILEEAAAKE